MIGFNSCHLTWVTCVNGKRRDPALISIWPNIFFSPWSSGSSPIFTWITALFELSAIAMSVTFFIRLYSDLMSVPDSRKAESLSSRFSTDICRSKRPAESGLSSESSFDLRCKYYKANARKWWKVDILSNALTALNYPVSVQCVSSTNSLSPMVYDPEANTILIAPASFYTPFSFRRAIARGMVYAFDNARAKLDYSNAEHLLCTSIRGVNLSGECDLWSKWTDYIGEDPLGMNMYSMKQRCVRSHAKESILVEASDMYSPEVVDATMDKVWERCFRDHWPFTAEPHMDTRFRDSPRDN